MLSHEEVQSAISARLDGERYDVADDVIDAHVAGCPECAAFQEDATALSRTLGLAESSDGMAPPQDLADMILAGVEPEWRAASAARQSTLAVLRVAAVVLALVFVAWAVAIVVDASSYISWVDDGKTLSPDADPDRANLLMISAALRFGLAFGLVFSAWRPSFAPGVLTVATPMNMFLAGFAMRDIALETLGLDRVYVLVGLGATVVVLGWMWAADKGYVARALWRQLSSDPL